MKKAVWGVAAAVALVLAGCAAKRVNSDDLYAWKGVPVEALDTHPLFSTLPMTKGTGPNGIEVRTYQNSKQSSACKDAMLGGVAVLDCGKQARACTTEFYVQDQRVIEALARGPCYTDRATRPAAKYLGAK